MKTIEKKIAKNGNTVYYMVDENGKKRQVSRKTAQEFIASNNREENKMENNIGNLNDSALAASNSRLAAFRTANETDSTEIDSADIAETDGSEEDIDDYTAELNETFNLLPAISELNDVDNTEPAKIDNTAAIKMTKKAAKEQKWLADAKVDDNGKMQIYMLWEGDGTMAYLINTKGKKTRVNSKFAYQLLEQGRAVRINKAA